MVAASQLMLNLKLLSFKGESFYETFFKTSFD
jgi:hypothetical protein